MVRRVVTAQSGDQSLVASDSIVSPTTASGVAVHELWRAEAGGREYPADQPWALEPPLGGHVFRLVIFPPGSEPWMHRTDTIDYALVLDGELTLLTDKEEVVLKPGDVVVQGNANHAWANRTAKPIKMVVVLINITG